jgi:hypothetical protein
MRTTLVLRVNGVGWDMSQEIAGPKRVEFCYNGDNENRDVEVDILGDLPYYQVGELVTRMGKSWKVTQVLIQQAISGPQPLPAHIVSLTDKF